jgi:hypothetical protein
VITAILHRCILEGDYIRAGRAWGLILRDEFCGRTIDVRDVSRWGIGAEILLWNGTETVQPSDEKGNDSSRQAGLWSVADGGREWFSRTGFEKARNYYERLVLQYPFRKSAPDAVNPLDFYPAMFGLWISVVQEEGRRMRSAASVDVVGCESDCSNGDYDDPFTSSVSVLQERWKEHVVRARGKELAEAQQIASQMDELLVSPPFSDSRELLRLRGMISLWIGDLHVSSVLPEAEVSTVSSGEEVESSLARIEIGLAMERKTAEIAKAIKLFERAKGRIRRGSLSLDELQLDSAPVG